MGRVTHDILCGGFTFRDDDGTSTHYARKFFGRGYNGNDGSRIDMHFFGGGFTVRDNYGRTIEVFRPRIFGGGYVGSRGTRIYPDILFGGYTVDRGWR